MKSYLEQIKEILDKRGEQEGWIENVWLSWWENAKGCQFNDAHLPWNWAKEFLKKYEPKGVQIYTPKTILFTICYDGDYWFEWIPRDATEFRCVSSFGGG